MLVIPCDPAGAQGTPEPPISPKSEQDCENWRDEYNRYLDQQRDELNQCDRANDNVPVQKWVRMNLCSRPPIEISERTACVPIYMRRDCDIENFAPKIHACFAAVPRTKDASKSEDLSRDLLKKTATGVPDVAASYAMRMAGYLGGPAVKLAVKGYNATALLNQISKAYDPKQPVLQRLQAISNLASTASPASNPFSQDLLSTAIAGLVATNEAALSTLLQDLDALSAEVGSDNEAAARRAIEQAQAEAARAVARRRLSEARARARASQAQMPLKEQAPAQSLPTQPPAETPLFTKCKYYKMCVATCPGNPYFPCGQSDSCDGSQSDCLRGCERGQNRRLGRGVCETEN